MNSPDPLDPGLALVRLLQLASPALPKIDVDPETYVVRADGELLACEPATELPLAQRYFLF